MKKMSVWKKKLLPVCMAGLLSVGWIAGAGTESVWALPSRGVAVGGNINVRDQANGNLVGSLEAGQEVSIQNETQSSDGYTWYEITFDFNGTETTGWVRSDLLSTGDGDTEEGDASEEEGDGEEGTFQSGNKAYDIASELPEEELPDGFSKTTITYQGTEVPAAKLENADLFLLYLQRVSDTSDKSFFVFDEERDSVIPLIMKKNDSGFVVLVNVPESVASGVSSLYTAGTCELEEGSVMAYQQTASAQNTDSSAQLSDFYYVYGVSDEGQSGWYVYDAAEKTLQRSVANMQFHSEAEQDTSDHTGMFETDSIVRMLIGALGLICLLLIALTIIFAVRYRKLRSFLEDEFEDEEDWEEERALLETIEAEKKAEKVRKKEKTKEKAKSTKKEPEKREEPEIPESIIANLNFLDLDQEPEENPDVYGQKEEDYDIPVDHREDYDLTSDNSEEDELEFEQFEEMLRRNISGEAEEEPEFYDEEEEEPVSETETTEEAEQKPTQNSEWDEDLEFL